ncbi:SusC/RagA family TonB-linked outer membrane protein [Desertivirga xinjiangensis]|uniref:SusC/RagA family TonB-linked outer membrane protein n=1 Tax=Desertivirga xinjiangensis TaxID=539206 RepID=UPI002109500F|nr:SusC/RagA family TonB-linked outer membrane protein [Pedobacter xinjiangensis]
MYNYYLRRIIHSFFILGLVSGSTSVFSQNSKAESEVDTLLGSKSINLLNKSQPKKNLLQATSTVYTNSLVTTPAPSFLQALSGKLSGLYTRQRSGIQDTDNPTSVMEFKIRGQVPLILIDGVPRDFASIEPESIESITILKDALGTVMFGQRSSSNIIQVTTKRPTVTPFKLSFTAQHGLQEQLNRSKAVNAAEYAILYNEARNNDGLPPVYTPADILAYRNGSDPLFHPDNDYRKLFLKKNATLDRYNLNVQSGNEIARFYVAMDYQKEGGFFNTADLNEYDTNSSVDRYIIRSNVSVDLTKALNVSLNIFGRIQNANEPGGDVSNNSSATTNIYEAINNTPNNAYSIFNPDGSLAGNSTFSNNIYGMLNNAGYNKATSRDLAADIEVTQKLDKLLPGLWAKATVSYNNTVDQSVDRAKNFAVYSLNIGSGLPVYSQIGTNTNQPNELSLSARRTYLYEKLSFGYGQSFGEHNLNLLLLGDNQATTLDLDLPSKFTNLAGSATYNYKEKYFAEAALSYGGYNRFAPGKRFGLFYAAALGWDLAQEDFLKDIKWISTLKPRINFGRTGNANVGYYVYDQYYGTTSPASPYYFGVTPTAVRGYEEKDLSNPNATWEKANKLNIGLDAGFFNNRLKISSEYFRDSYYDLMQVRGNSIQLIGQTFTEENLGKNRFTGFENNISWNGRSSSVGYFVNGNISVLRSKVVFQDEVYREFDYQRRTGLPVGYNLGYIADGFFQSQAEIDASPVVDGYTPKPGDLKYRDLNDDGIINQFDITSIGTKKPMIYYGLTTGFNVKRFDLTVSIQGVANRDIVLTGAQEWEFQSSGNGQAYEHHLNRWTPTNSANATYPRLSIGSNANNQRNSTFWVRSAAYLRLQNVDLGYTIPGRVTQKIKLNNVRVFANGFNLYSFDSLDHNDAENNNSIFPLRRTFNLGLNIKL